MMMFEIKIYNFHSQNPICAFLLYRTLLQIDTVCIRNLKISPTERVLINFSCTDSIFRLVLKDQIVTKSLIWRKHKAQAPPRREKIVCPLKGSKSVPIDPAPDFVQQIEQQRKKASRIFPTACIAFSLSPSRAAAPIFSAFSWACERERRIFRTLSVIYISSATCTQTHAFGRREHES
jgi:hypothetical protein